MGEELDHSQIPQRRELPKIIDTHKVSVSGMQLNKTATAYVPVVQVQDTEDKLGRGELLTGGRAWPGDVSINCGSGDGQVSRESFTVSASEQRVTVNTLSGNPSQVLVFRNGQLETNEEIQKQLPGLRGVETNESVHGIPIGDDDVTVFIALGQPQTDEGPEQTMGGVEASGIILGEHLASAFLEWARAQQDGRNLEGEMRKLVNHQNFVRLDFKKTGDTRVGPLEAEENELFQTHEVTCVRETHYGPDDVDVRPLPAYFPEKLLDGTLIVGNYPDPKGGYHGVDVNITDEAVARRHALIRLEPDNTVAVECLSKFGATLHIEDSNGITMPIGLESGVGRVKIPDEKTSTLILSLGNTPSIMELDGGRHEHFESNLDTNESVPSIGELSDPGPQGKYQIKLKFRPQKLVTIGDG